jgi:hypothetical protein
MAEEIEIIITPDGIRVDTKGFTGPACTETLEKILADLAEDGIEVTDRDLTKKRDYYVRADANRDRHQVRR